MNTDEMTRGKKLFHGSLWNFAGHSLPIICAILVLPYLIAQLGAERFGFLTLVWALVGYLGVLDLGIGKAITKTISEKLALGELSQIPTLVWSGLVPILSIGIVSMAILSLNSGWIVSSYFNAPYNIENELKTAISVLSLSIPLVVLNSGLRGVLEANQRFDLLNIVRAPIGMLNYIAPAITTIITTNLSIVLAALLASRLIAFIVLAIFCGNVVPGIWSKPRLSFFQIRHLFFVGGWITLVSIINPLLVVLDRFIVGGLVPLEEVQNYTIPSEIISKLWIIPNSLLLVLFPAFSGLWKNNRPKARSLYVRSMKYLFFIILLTTILIWGGGEYFISLWLGIEISQQSGHILQILGFGYLFNTLCYPAYALLLGIGKSKLVLAVLLLEVSIFPAALWAITSNFGIEGAAIASSIRYLLETIILVGITRSILQIETINILYWCISLLSAFILGMFIILQNYGSQIVIIFASITTCSLLIWKFGLDNEEKNMILNKKIPFKESSKI